MIQRHEHGDNGSRERAHCPACGSVRLVHFGRPRIRPTGIVSSHADDVCRCRVCDLLFFVPVQSVESVLGEYAGLSGDYWTGEGYSRPDWTLASRAVFAHMVSGRILDVGCWTGGFVASLPDAFEKHGVEPSAWASAEASERGVAMLGGSLSDCVGRVADFDVITFIDVLEHSTSPFKDLCAAFRLLRPGGIMIVATGNSRSLPWLLMPRDHWYYFDEHKCFFSDAWFRWACRETHLQHLQTISFSHFPDTSWGARVDLARALAFRVLGGPASLPYRVARRARVFALGPGTVRWKDHFVVVLGRQDV